MAEMSLYCEVCDLDIVDEHSLRGHVLGQKHLRNVQKGKEKISLQQTSIFVAPLPPWASRKDILSFFEKYAPIEHYSFENRSAIIKFNNRDVVETLLNKPVYIKNWRLNIKQRIIRDEEKKKRSQKKIINQKKSSEENSSNDLKLELEKISDFDSQLEKFLVSVQPNNSIEQKYNEICQSLNSVLVPFFPNCRAIKFGSTVTGLQLVGSDVDIYFDIGEKVIDGNDLNLKVNQQIWTSKSVFKKIKMELFKHSNIFSQVVPIPSAKVPIIKFHHIKTNLDCDLSFIHGLGVYNSELIKHYLNMDSRIKPLLIILKYLGKNLMLTGNGKITNYALIMITLFYLQQKEPRLIPTVKELRENCNPHYYKGWQVNFSSDYKIPEFEIDTKITIPELLCEFFEFYYNFDFKNFVICPLDGNAYKRSDFKNIINQSNGLLNDFNLYSSVCIQDPNQLNRNIASNWDRGSLNKFHNFCSRSLTLCNSYKLNNTNKLLPTLCDNKFKFEMKKHKSEIIELKLKNLSMFNLPDDFNKDNSISDVNGYKQNHWFLSVSKLIRKVLENVMKLKVEQISDDDFDGTDNKQLKLQENSDVHSKKYVDELMFICQGDYCLNRNRKNRAPCLDPSLSIIDKETLVSDSLIEKMIKNNCINPVKFMCKLEKKVDPLKVDVILVDRKYDNNSFSDVTGFLKSKLSSFITNEIIHMLQYNKKIDIT